MAKAVVLETVAKPKAEAKAEPKVEIKQKLVSERNIERRKAEGWKIVDIGKANLDKKFLDNLKNNSDLVLMEKEI